MTDECTEILQLNQRLLDCIAQADWATYSKLCDASLTAYEPEGCGQIIEGLPFHRFYFNLGASSRSQNTTMCSPHVRMLGDVAVVSCVRLNQRLNATGSPYTQAFEETRIWHKKDGVWKHVHFHRSQPCRESCG